MLGTLIDAPPSHSDTVLTTLSYFETTLTEHGMNTSNLSADMHCYIVATFPKWASHGNRLKSVILRPGGMHTLMSFNGCIGNWWKLVVLMYWLVLHLVAWLWTWMARHGPKRAYSKISVSMLTQLGNHQLVGSGLTAWYGLRSLFANANVLSWNMIMTFAAALLPANATLHLRSWPLAIR